MVNKLKLVTITFEHLNNESHLICDTHCYVISYSDFKKYLKDAFRSGIHSSCRLFYSSGPVFRLDNRSCIPFIIRYFVDLYLRSSDSELLDELLHVVIRIKTLSEATSDLINDFLVFNVDIPFSKGYYELELKGDLNLAMLSSSLCLSKQLLESGHWEEYHFISKEKL